MWSKEITICHSICILSPPECVWKHVTDVDIASFQHPVYFAVLGIPKPMRSEIRKAGVGGERIAYFENQKRFTQVITYWKPYEEYSFTFHADPGFRVGYVLDLAAGPFQMKSGSYSLSQG